ncbi:MAG: SAM-dependent methyltransferase [Candidatus Thioglobus sp.]|nr:SAM-dependent methyltransferase [Candidatus Thioglobus sp.]
MCRQGISAELKDRQHKALSKVLPELMERIIWLKSLPESFSGVVIANEVLDALPAKRLIKNADGFRELGVDYQAGKLVWQEFNQPYINDKILLPNQAENGYTTEINPRALAWINTLGEVLERGLILLIDYGFTQAEFFHPQRHAGTLRCYYQHQASDNPFVNIGAQDITTSVNFSALAQQAKKSGLSVEGFATQAMFLISLGISEYLSAENNKQKRTELAAEIKQLVLPGAMGESFKVLALSKKTKVKSGKLTGFLEQDLTYKL